MEFLVDIKNMMMPEAIIVAGILILMILFLIYKKAKQSAYTIAILSLIIAFGAALTTDTSSSGTAFYGAFLSNKFTTFFKELILIASIFSVLLSDKYIKTIKKNAAEFYMLLLTAVLGGMVLVSSNDLITLFISIETLSICSYILSGFLKEEKSSSEAALKYLITGAVASAFLLYGFSFLYGLSSSMQFDLIKAALMNPEFFQIGILSGIMVISGICFKLAVIPFYNWAADVYQGAPLPISAFLSVTSKIAGFGILLRIMSEFLGVIWILYGVLFLISAISMTVGNFLALKEKNIKRFMAYSSIAHAGYILAPLLIGGITSTSAMIFYIITYVFMNFALWGCIETIDKTPNTTINDFKGLVYKNPYVAIIMSVALISLAGLPLGVGFFSKFYLVQAIAFAGFDLFAFVLIILFNSLIAVYYYFNIIKILFDEVGFSKELIISKRLKSLLFISATVTLFAGLFSGPIIEYSQAIAKSQIPMAINYDELRDSFINSIE